MSPSNPRLVIALFLMPSLVLFLVYYAVPLAEVLVTSFCSWSFGSRPDFIGLGNYAALFRENPDFAAALKNTMLWVLLSVCIGTPFAVLVAMVLAKKPFGWKFARNAFVLPNIISSAAIAMIFMNLLDNDYGIVNSIIRVFRPDFNLSWLSEGNTAFIAVTCSFLFFVGTYVLLLMAEIASLPHSVIESAKIDGASSWQIDGYIVIPMLKNIIGTVTILGAGYAITQFSEVYILTGGGPGNATLNLGVYLFNAAVKENNMALANTVGVVQIAIGLLVVFLLSKLFRLGNSYE